MSGYIGNRDISLSGAVVEAVADREGVDPANVHPPLYSVIDTDALDAIFASTHGNSRHTIGEITFQYCGYSVTVDDSGTVTIDRNS